MLIRALLALSLFFTTYITGDEKKCYVTFSFGGQLGNNLFQVATAISYALDHGCEASFPTLQDLPVKSFFLNKVDMSSFPHNIEFKEYREMSWYFDPIPKSEHNLILHGFFQSEKYFYNHRNYIIDLFSPTPEIVEHIKNRYRSLLEVPNVAIHIRTFIHDGNDPTMEGNWGEF